MAEIPYWRQLMNLPVGGRDPRRGLPGEIEPGQIEQSELFTGPDFVPLQNTVLPPFQTPADGGGGGELPPFRVFPPSDGGLPVAPLDPREQISQEGADFDVQDAVAQWEDDQRNQVESLSGGFRNTLPRGASMAGGLLGGPLVGAGMSFLRDRGLEQNRLYGNELRGMVKLDEVGQPNLWGRFGFGDDPRLSGYDENFRAIEDEMIDRYATGPGRGTIAGADTTARQPFHVNPNELGADIAAGEVWQAGPARAAARTELAGATFNDPRAGIASNIGGTFANPYVSYNNTGTPGAAPIGYEPPDLAPGGTTALDNSRAAIEGALQMAMVHSQGSLGTQYQDIELPPSDMPSGGWSPTSAGTPGAGSPLPDMGGLNQEFALQQALDLMPGLDPGLGIPTPTGRDYSITPGGGFYDTQPWDLY
jgi:hypothetical protein